MHWGGEVAGVGDDNLRGDRGDANEGASDGEYRHARGKIGSEQGDDGEHHHGFDEAVPAENIAKRHDEEQSEGVTQLRQHGDHANGGLANAVGSGNQPFDGLDKIQVGYDDAGSNSHEHDGFVADVFILHSLDPFFNSGCFTKQKTATLRYTGMVAGPVSPQACFESLPAQCWLLPSHLQAG